MMHWARLLNPFRHLRIERENARLTTREAGLVKHSEGQQRAIRSFAENIGRQAPAGTITEAQAHVVLLDGRNHALEVAAGIALTYLSSGRPDAAKDVLAAILDSAPAEEREAS